MAVLEKGFSLIWEDGPPTATPPRSFPPPREPEAEAALEAEVGSLVEKGAVERLSSAPAGFYGRLFTVPKATGGYRPVLDLSPLNAHLKHIPFRMESPSSFREALRPGDWVTSIDLKDAYFHVPIAPGSRKWLRFVWKGSPFQFRALPFGLSQAPWIFTTMVKELCRYVRARGVRLRVYLDDWAILSQSQEECRAHTALVLQAAEDMGFRINLAKCDLTPAQSFLFLGMCFNTVDFTVAPSQRRVDNLQALLAALLQREWAPVRSVLSVLGSMESMCPLIRGGRLHKRPLQRALADRWSQSWESPSALIRLGPWFREAVSFWLSPSALLLGVPISPPPDDLCLYTDASKQGWGAHLLEQEAAGLWSQSESLQHINLLELEAVRRALLAFESSVSGRRLKVFTDNTTVAWYINKQGGTRSRPLSLATEALLVWCSDRQIALSARHIPGIMNVLADSLSRAHQVLPTEWTLAHEVLLPVWERWGKPHVDLFATRYSRRLSLFVSPIPDPQAWAVDALSVSWTGLSAYAFPPLALLPRVLRKIEMDEAELILIAPLWPAQQWYPDLLALAREPPLPLSLGHRSLLQPRSGIPHGNPQGLALHAWSLSGKL